MRTKLFEYELFEAKLLEGELLEAKLLEEELHRAFAVQANGQPEFRWVTAVIAQP